MRSKKSFTLVEIMIAITVIGLLMSAAIPAFFKIIDSTKVNRFLNDIKVVSNAFEFYSFDKGVYPPDAVVSVVPDGMAYYLKDFPWTESTTIGGMWDWDNFNGISGSITVNGYSISAAQLLSIDMKIDDGDLSSGIFIGQLGLGNCIYLLN